MRYKPGHKQATRDRIIAAAGRLFRERGYEATGVDAIMAEAGLTLEEWRKQTGAELLASASITQKIIEGPQSWHVVRFP